jgi:hypothetical protein
MRITRHGPRRTPKLSLRYDPIVAAPVGDQQCAAVVLDLDEARLVALWRTVEPAAAPCRQDKKWRGGDEGTSHRIDVVDFFPEDAL